MGSKLNISAYIKSLMVNGKSRQRCKNFAIFYQKWWLLGGRMNNFDLRSQNLDMKWENHKNCAISRVSVVRKSQEFRVPGQEKSIFSKKSGKQTSKSWKGRILPYFPDRCKYDIKHYLFLNIRIKNIPHLHVKNL